MKKKTWSDYYAEARAAGTDDASACHAADLAMEADGDIAAAEIALADPAERVTLDQLKTKLSN